MDDRFQHLLSHQGQLVHVDHSHRLADHEQAATGLGIDSSTQTSPFDTTIFQVKHVGSDNTTSALGMKRASAMYFTVTEVMRKTKVKVENVLDRYISGKDGPEDRKKFENGKDDFDVEDGVTQYKLEKVNGKFQCSVTFKYKHTGTGDKKETTFIYRPNGPGRWMPKLDEDAEKGVFYIFKQFVDERVFAVQEHVRNPVRARVYMARLVNSTQP